jgi:hypothetical protein
MSESRVYRAADGQWIYFDGAEKHFFATEGEARMANQKEIFAQKAQEAATTLAQVGDRLDDLVTVYFDRGYNSGGANGIDDSDLTSLGITAAQLGGLITLAQQLSNFRNNQAVTTADYDVTLNALRTDV